MMIMASVAVVCFLGGWTLPSYIMNLFPFLEKIPFFGLIVFLLKMYVCIFAYYWVRATLPRYRYDQLMSMGWKFLIPLALLNIVITGLVKLLI